MYTNMNSSTLAHLLANKYGAELDAQIASFVNAFKDTHTIVPLGSSAKTIEDLSTEDLSTEYLSTEDLCAKHLSTEYLSTEDLGMNDESVNVHCGNEFGETDSDDPESPSDTNPRKRKFIDFIRNTSGQYTGVENHAYTEYEEFEYARYGQYISDNYFETNTSDQQ